MSENYFDSFLKKCKGIVMPTFKELPEDKKMVARTSVISYFPEYHRLSFEELDKEIETFEFTEKGKFLSSKEKKRWSPLSAKH